MLQIVSEGSDSVIYELLGSVTDMLTSRVAQKRIWWSDSLCEKIAVPAQGAQKTGRPAGERMSAQEAFSQLAGTPMHVVRDRRDAGPFAAPNALELRGEAFAIVS